MAKPSIFSNNYSSKMRRRKKRNKVFLAIVIICIILVFCICNFNYAGIKAWTKNNLTFISNLFQDKKPTVKVQNNNSSKPSNIVDNNASNKVVSETGYDVTLTSDKVKAIYEGKDDSLKFKYVTPADSTVYYRISPSGKEMIIFDNTAQSILFLDSNGKVTDITMKSYISSAGTEFTKENVLQEKPDYVWATSPSFVDDDNVAYISQLPYFIDETRYVWIYNIKSGAQILKMELQGIDVKFSAITDKGLTVVSDGKTEFLNGNGNVSN